jgi:dTDP-4-dehydrorhamnose reductase
MRILVLGGSGLLGSELLRQATAGAALAFGTYHRGHASTVGIQWHQLDLRDRCRTFEVMREVQPEVVINAAYRQHDWATTADGAANAASAAAAVGAHSVLVSSDAVFSGRDLRYPEASDPDPISPYGAAKAAAETAVRAIQPTATIVRTSLIISSDGSSEHERRSYAAVNREEVLFTDDVRCPVHVADLAAAILELAASRIAGMHHVAGPQALSRYDLGRLIALRDGLDPGRIRTGRRAELELPGPLDVRLDASATQARIKTRLRAPSVFLAPLQSARR